MPYIGKQLVRGQNRKLDDISSGFNGSQPTFTLQVASQNVTVGSALQLWISLGGVIQNPLTDFTVAGNQITFTTPPAASLDFFGVIQGDVTDTNTPGDATVTTSKLATGLTVNLADGSAATSSLQLGGTDSGLFSSAADKVNVTTGGVERLEIGDSEVVFNDPSNDVDFRVESNGNANMLFVDGGNDRVGIGKTPATYNLEVNGGTADTVASFESTDATARILFKDNSGEAMVGATGDELTFYTTTSATERMRIDSSGNVGIGTTDPKRALHLDGGSGSVVIQLTNDTTGKTTDGDGFQLQVAGDGTARVVQRENLDLAFDTNNTERARINSSGKLLVGTSSSRIVGSARNVQIEGTSDASAGVSLVRNSNDSNSPTINIGKSRGTSAGSNTVVQDDDGLGSIYFRGADGTDLNTIGAAIEAAVDGTPGSNDLPGRLVFSTTADGASSTTERMRINSSGDANIGSSTYSGIGERLCLTGNGLVTQSAATTNRALFGTFGGSDLIVGTFDSNDMKFRTGNNEKARITTGGYFKAAHDGGYIGTSSSWHEFTGTTPNGYSLKVHCDNASPLSHYISEIKFSATAPNNGNAKFLQCNDTTGAKINLDSDGGIHNYQSNDGNLCDEREKKNIVSLETKWDKVKSWELKKFHYNEDADTDDLRYGVIAQQVEEHCPEVLTDWIKQRAEDAVLDDDGNVVTPAVPEVIRKGIKEQQMMWMAIKALQEAQTRIETLEAKVAALEAE